jgi:hypothetical protein
MNKRYYLPKFMSKTGCKLLRYYTIKRKNGKFFNMQKWYNSPMKDTGL